VGLVICPGGGFKDVWLDREGHDLALRLKEQNVTSLVLKYRTRMPNEEDSTKAWQNYMNIVQADAWQAIRTLRSKATELGLQPNKIGICGFSAGGHLAITSALNVESKSSDTEVSSVPDFAGLFYPGIPEEAGQTLKRRLNARSSTPPICPFFIMNAGDDKVTPADKCAAFYLMLLQAGVKAELHIYGKGSHGFDLGVGRGKSASLWPDCFVAWLQDSSIIPQ
jgi:acetyl esterase/lipase